MLRFITGRLLKVLVSLFIVVTAVFFAFQFVPGDPAQLLADQQTQQDVERVREYLGLNDPLSTQYLRYISGIVRGDLGVSAIRMDKVSSAIASRLPATLLLLCAAMLVTIVIGIPAGVVAALNYRSAIDYVVMLMAVGSLSVPNFYIGLLMVSLFSVTWGILPTSGFRSPLALIMPTLAVAVRLIGAVARMTRASVLEVMRQDYIQMARAKGVAELGVVFRHVLRNALMPTLTLIGLQIGYLFGGSIVIEVLFAWPGIGELTRTAISMRDYNMVQGTTIVFVGGFLLVTLLVDILYALIDPRIVYD